MGRAALPRSQSTRGVPLSQGSANHRAHPRFVFTGIFERRLDVIDGRLGGIQGTGVDGDTTPGHSQLFALGMVKVGTKKRQASGRG